MAVYKVEPIAHKFKGFYPAETDENAILEMEGGLDFLGKKRADDWKEIPVYMAELEDEDQGKHPIPDIARFQGTLIFSEKAKDILKPHLSPEDELLELHHNGATWYVLNVMKKVEATDKEKSKYHFGHAMSILDVKKYVFKTEMLKDVNLFKMGDTNYVDIYCNEGSLKKAIEDNGLTGIQFVKL